MLTRKHEKKQHVLPQQSIYTQWTGEKCNSMLVTKQTVKFNIMNEWHNHRLGSSQSDKKLCHPFSTLQNPADSVPSCLKNAIEV